jgi:predicted transcriptional regulator
LKKGIVFIPSAIISPLSLKMRGYIVSEELDRSTLAALTAEITAAYVGNNPVSLTDMGSLIAVVADNLRQLGAEPKVEEAAKPEPAVPIRRSIQSDHVICLICGSRQKMLKRHLARHHELTPDEYRAMFELKHDYPMVAPDYAAHRSELAKKIGLGRKEPAEMPKKTVRKSVPKPRRAKTEADQQQVG